MIKNVEPRVWVFDLEWVPDPGSGRRVLGLGADTSDADVLEAMYQDGGASEDDPRPYLKTALCRIVSVATVIRTANEDRNGPGHLTLFSLPDPAKGPLDEAELVGRFLDGIGESRPQLVGYNITGADLPILVQRAVAHRITAPKFGRRPNKPWEGIDYFARYGDWAIDLRDVLGGWGKSTPSLHEIAAASRIPGKLDVDGSQVVDLWTAGKIDEIVAYNEFDAITTYLVWLRSAHVAGLVTTRAFDAEERALEDLLAKEAGGSRPHLARYLEAWDAMRT